MILCHLYTLTDELSDPEALLHNYVPGLIKYFKGKNIFFLAFDDLEPFHRCCKSPAMKIRTFIAKSICSIINLDRYPNLFDQLFKIDLNNNNELHGRLEIFTRVSEKHNVFKYITFASFQNELSYFLNMKLFVQIFFKNSLKVFKLTVTYLVVQLTFQCSSNI